MGGTIATYVAGGPIVHAAHGNWVRALGSAGLRMGLPVVGVLLGAALEDCTSGDFCGARGATIGLSTGIGVAVAFDAAVLARETLRDEPVATPVVTPVVTTGKNGTWLGLSGRF